MFYLLKYTVYWYFISMFSSPVDKWGCTKINKRRLPFWALSFLFVFSAWSGGKIRDGHCALLRLRITEISYQRNYELLFLTRVLLWVTPIELLLFYMCQQGIVKWYAVYPPLKPLNLFSLPPSVFRQREDFYSKAAICFYLPESPHQCISMGPSSVYLLCLWSALTYSIAKCTY